MDNQDVIIDTKGSNHNGQNKCPKCGATDISLNIKTGLLRCEFCRHEFSAEKMEEDDLTNLKGQVRGEGAKDIVIDDQNMVTFKCSSCGALVVVDTSLATSARCHWCRNTLSVNEKVPNGAVPDMILPFKISKEEAQAQIKAFVGKRKFFANETFKKEFTPENTFGVYLPYMIVDANTHAELSGEGEHEIRRYTEKVGDVETTYYDAEVYDVTREFDLTISGLTVESSRDKLDTDSELRTNNIINSIMPFDTENCVKWDANYLKGYNSEKRDVDVDDLKATVLIKSKDIARFACNDSIDYYDRGVRWDKEDLNIIGQKWMSAYLPVWLYSYMERKKDKTLLHYVAVNARTKETMGSVPLNKPKLLIFSTLMELAGLVLMLMTYSDDNRWPWLFLLAGFIYYFVIYSRYRNKGARHYHEKETNHTISYTSKDDKYVKKITRVTNSSILGANNQMVYGDSNNVSSFKKAINDIANDITQNK